MSEWQESQSVEERRRGWGGALFFPAAFQWSGSKGGKPATLGLNIGQNAMPHGRWDKI